MNIEKLLEYARMRIAEKEMMMDPEAMAEKAEFLRDSMREDGIINDLKKDTE